MPRPRLLNFAGPSQRLRPGPKDQPHEGYRIVRNDTTTTTPVQIYFYDDVGFWGITAGDFVNAIKGIGPIPIDLHLNSNGGDVFDGIAIYNAIQSHPADVVVYVDGLAASCASFIACAGDRLVMAKNAMLMIHDAWTVTAGNEIDHHAGGDLLGKISDQIAGIYADKTGTDPQLWRTAMQTPPDGVWYTAAEALDAGLADEVTQPPEKTAAEPANTWQQSILAHFRAQPEAPAAPEPQVNPEPVWDLEAIRNSLREAVK